MHQTNTILTLQMKRRDNCVHMLYFIYYASCHTDQFMCNRALWGSFLNTPSARATVSDVLYLLPTFLWVMKISLTGIRTFSYVLNDNSVFPESTIFSIGLFIMWVILVLLVVLVRSPSNDGINSIHIPHLPSIAITPLALSQGCAALICLVLHVFLIEFENNGQGWRGQFCILLLILTTVFPPIIEGIMDLAAIEDEQTLRTSPPWIAPHYKETPCGNAHSIVLFGVKYAALSLLVSDVTLFDGRFLVAALYVRIIIVTMGLPKALMHEASECVLPGLWNVETDLGRRCIMCCAVANCVRVAMVVESEMRDDTGVLWKMHMTMGSNLINVCLLLAANALMRVLDELGRWLAKSIMKSFGENPTRNPASVGNRTGVICFGLWLAFVMFPVLGGGGDEANPSFVLV